MANRYLTLEEIISGAATLVKGASAEELLYFKQWSWEALRNIGPTSDNFATTTLSPEDYVLRKPDDLLRVLDLGLFDASGSELKSKYRSGKSRVHQDRNTYNDVYIPTFNSIITISEDSHFFYLSSNSVNVSYALLRYVKLPVDSDNNPIFPEHVAHAVRMFILWYWAIRESKDTGNAEERYKKARNEARAVGKLPNGLVMKQIAREWNSMIQYYNPDRF